MNLGKLAEDEATKHLLKNHYKILERNFRTKFGELDIICQKEKTIVVVEVKALTSSEDFYPEQHFTKEKLNKIIKTFNYFLKIKDLKYKDLRIDLIALEFSSGSLKEIRHYQNLEI